MLTSLIRVSTFCEKKAGGAGEKDKRYLTEDGAKTDYFYVYTRAEYYLQ